MRKISEEKQRKDETVISWEGGNEDIISVSHLLHRQSIRNAPESMGAFHNNRELRSQSVSAEITAAVSSAVRAVPSYVRSDSVDRSLPLIT